MAHSSLRAERWQPIFGVTARRTLQENYVLAFTVSPSVMPTIRAETIASWPRAVLASNRATNARWKRGGQGTTRAPLEARQATHGEQPDSDRLASKFLCERC